MTSRPKISPAHDRKILQGAPTHLRTPSSDSLTGDGFITTAVNWDDTRTQINWYRDAGGTGTVVVNTIPLLPGAEISETAFVEAALDGLERSRALGADETHIVLNLRPLTADEQVELLEALAARL
ncbi:hypothetical protein GCM10010411_90240 [Actinomadura fulvescens]|uniref:Luciferase-like domain-containing protein n=1 Tax=Actinomadura fulvescens TaxID=46160 RepID=A0ABP6DDC0_9ACTN